jgi:hypothetical protein
LLLLHHHHQHPKPRKKTKQNPKEQNRMKLRRACCNAGRRFVQKQEEPLILELAA